MQDAERIPVAYVPLGAISRLLICLLVLDALVSVLDLMFRHWSSSTFASTTGIYITSPVLLRAAACLTSNFVPVICLGLSALWLYLMRRNLVALGVSGLRFSPGRSLLWFVVPPYNVIRPCRIMKESFASVSQPPGATATEGTTNRSSAIDWWCRAWMLSLILLYVFVGYFLLNQVVQRIPAVHLALPWPNYDTVITFKQSIHGVLSALSAMAVYAVDRAQSTYRSKLETAEPSHATSGPARAPGWAILCLTVLVAAFVLLETGVAVFCAFPGRCYDMQLALCERAVAAAGKTLGEKTAYVGYLYECLGRNYYMRYRQSQQILKTTDDDFKRAKAHFATALAIRKVTSDRMNVIYDLEELTWLCGQLSSHPECIAWCGELINLVPDKAYGYQRRADAYFFLNQFEKAAQDYLQTVRLSGPTGKVEFCGNLGYTQEMLNDFTGASDNYSRAILADPRNIDALIARSRSCAKAGNFAQAIASLDEVLRIAPDNDVALRRRAFLYLKLGKLPNTLADCRMLIVRSDREEYSEEAFRFRAKALERTGAMADAVSDLTTAIALKSYNYPDYLNRARLWNKLGKFDDARRDATVVINLALPESPDLAAAYELRAIAYEKLGQKELAIEDHRLSQVNWGIATGATPPDRLPHSGGQKR